MKHLVQIINEGDINRTERKYREFCKLCKVYDHDIDMKDICVHKTSKNNWAVYKKDGDDCKKLFIASYLVLDDDVIEQKGIKVYKESLNESVNKWELVFMQFDSQDQEEYENGDMDWDDLVDGMFEDEDIKHVFITASNRRDAEKKATKELVKIVNKNPEVVAVCMYYDNVDSGDCQTIFI